MIRIPIYGHVIYHILLTVFTYNSLYIIDLFRILMFSDLKIITLMALHHPYYITYIVYTIHSI